jgi:arginine/lysine/ornithine decarboxylase
MIVRPRDAFYSPKRSVKLEEAVGEISGEMIMAYPPGIPVICPGERITHEVVEYVQALKEEETQLQGTEDPFINYIKVLDM